jgi:uncharacterized protein YciI
MKFVLLYESADDVATKACPQSQGSMGIFRSRDGAEQFVAGDPFVLNGVVRGYEIRGWNELFSGQA